MTKKDYLMRIIKEVARVLASVMLGKKICAGRAPGRIKYQISGDKASPSENNGGQWGNQRGGERASGQNRLF